MVALAVDEPRVLHSLPGRLRVELPERLAEHVRLAETQLRALAGVRRARANPLTGNILIEFDQRATSQREIVHALDDLAREQIPSSQPAHESQLSRHSIRRERAGSHRRRVRVPVRGIEFKPALARQIEERLAELPSVTARVSELTGRVTVEYDERLIDLQDVIANLSDVDVPDLPDVDQPAYPMDPGPLINGVARTAGAGLGIALLLGRRLFGQQGPILDRGANTVADTLNIARGIPAIRYGVRRLVGHDAADLMFSGIGVVSLSLSNNVQGLILNGVEGFRLLTEVIPRREAWRRHLEREEDAAGIRPGTSYRPEPGDRVAYPSTVISGTGTAIAPDGSLVGLTTGKHIPAGSTIQGGPLDIRVQAGSDFEPVERAGPLRDTLLQRYLRYVVPASIGLSAVAGIVTRSPATAFNMLVQTGGRTALIGTETAGLGASARVLRSGVVVVGTRRSRTIRRPDTIVLDSARMLTNGYEISNTFPLTNELAMEEILSIAARVSTATGSPWGRTFPIAPADVTDEGGFDGERASARIAGQRWTLGPVDDQTRPLVVERFRNQGSTILALTKGESDGQVVALLVLRPRLTTGVNDLVNRCREHQVELVLCGEHPSATAREIAKRCSITPLDGVPALDIVQARQRDGAFVAVVSDHIGSAPAFSAADLSIGITERQPRFPARADLLSPDVHGVSEILEAGRQRDIATRDSVVLSIVSNIAGAALTARGSSSVSTAANAGYFTALGAIGIGWMRLRGGTRSVSAASQVREPQPERWGRLAVEDVLRAVESGGDGLTSEEAAARLRPAREQSRQSPLAIAVLEQLRSPLIGILSVGALLSLSFGAPADVAIIGATIVTNVAVGAWQARRADRASAAIARLGASECDVLRDSESRVVPASDLVPGDVLLLSAGARIAADARVIHSENMEVSEAALTGESLPVFKSVDGMHAHDRILLEGSDVITGSGRAVVVATGPNTKLGTLSAAITQREDVENPLNTRLMRMLNLTLPIAGAAGLTVMISGILRQRSVAAPLALGSSVAIAAVPEGMPLLAKMGEAAVGQRLASKRAVVRRLSAIEALGRVDVACVDKTGTLTTGQLEVNIVDDLAREMSFPGPLSERGVEILRTAALASPPPDDVNLSVHATDNAVVRAAVLAGINGDIEVSRQEDFPFGSERSYHASRVNDSVFFKGAPEVVLTLCSLARRNGAETVLDDDGRDELLERARTLAERGVRVLAVAQGPANTKLADPEDLVAIGFVGISDPLRAGVQQAVHRCHGAGVRVIMLTGDHPATARTIAREAGLHAGEPAVLIGSELGALDDRELDRRMERTTVVARATPIDKLRIVESLRRLGHTVAMTGDGVNDAPALRLADAGVAMGHGTEVARQAADIVLLDEDFATLVEALVEGRGFWQNIRRSVSLLLGGNLGELGLITGVSLLGLGTPLNTRQILAVNLITDVLPALAIALQPPRQRRLDRLAREGTSSFQDPLRNEIIRRGVATAAPSLLAYVLAARGGGDAATVAFSSIVATQFAQTLQAGWSEGSLSTPVLGAIGASTGLLIAALALSPVRSFLGLLPLSPFGFMLVGLASLLSAALARTPLPERGQSTAGASPQLRAV